MITIASSSPPRAAPVRQPQAAHRASHAPDDVRAMGRALDRARGPQGQQAGEGKPALAARGAKGQLSAAQAKAEQKQAGLAEQPAEQEIAGAGAREERRGGGYDLDRDSSQQQASPLLAATAPPPVQPIAVPNMPAPHVDPAVFGEMMTELWLREKSKGAKEVRVSFGQDAWPATGARIVRNAAGTLDVQLHVGDAGAAYGGDTLEALSRQLGERGLAIGAVQLAEGAVA